jgi:D-aminopeptidase
VTTGHIISAIKSAHNGQVEEGNVGAGTGTICFGWKGGIGTASRVIPTSLGGYTVGVLVQTNFGGILEVNGIPIGEELDRYYLKDAIDAQADGSCMIVVATDAPLSSRNLERLAKRAIMGLAKTGGIASNGSGDYVIAFSTDESIRVNEDTPFKSITELNNNALSPLFLATIEATEEAIINSLWAAETMSGRDNHSIEALPKGKVLEILKKYNSLKTSNK